MDIDEILKALTTLEEGYFPRAALEAAIAQRGAITPHLLRVLEETRQDELERMFAEANYMLPLYALYLLAQFRETRAYPLIVDIFAIPGEDVHDVFGDLVTEDLNRILASVSGGDVTGLHRLIEDPQVDEYVRAAAMEALVVLFAQDVLTRETVIAYFQYLFREGLERDYSFAWAALVAVSTDLYPEELIEDIERAFADDLVDEMFTDLAWVKECMEPGKEQVLAKLLADERQTFIEDTIANLEWWACFQPPEPRRRVVHPASAAFKPQKKIGRNEPCPCGSGKKYKHCCGKKA
ncbi:MAG: DUF1186 domain-containing protein [Anaerolineae bacterium]|nr:DUF1186 domain-containing protein [Anaerolineae bacterium]